MKKYIIIGVLVAVALCCSSYIDKRTFSEIQTFSHKGAGEDIIGIFDMPNVKFVDDGKLNIQVMNNVKYLRML